MDNLDDVLSQMLGELDDLTQVGNIFYTQIL